MMFLFFYTNYMSNFEYSPIVENSIMFGTSEQYFMYHKALKFNDIETANDILKYPFNPMKCKQFGRCVKGYDETVWNSVRYSVMYNANYLKYTQNHHLGKLLKQTGTKMLVEASQYDTVWGIGMSVEEANRTVTSTKQFKGQNLLGQVLMEVRDNLPTLLEYDVVTDNPIMIKRGN